MITIGNITAEDVAGNLIIKKDGVQIMDVDPTDTHAPIYLPNAFSMAKATELFALWAFNPEEGETTTDTVRRNMSALIGSMSAKYDKIEKQKELINFSPI